MGIHNIAERRALQAPRAARTRGALALAQPPTWTERSAQTWVPGAERVTEEGRVLDETLPGSVRVLPVAVPARRRPVYPTRGALSRVRAVGARSLDAGAPEAGAVQYRSGELWADVTAWGAEAGTRAPAPSPGGSRAAAPSTGGLRARALTSVPVAAGPPRHRSIAQILPAVSARRVRAVVLGLAVAVAVGVGVLAAFLAPAPFPALAQASAPSETVAVSAGESLWSIAAARTEPGTDVRDTMESIAAANALIDGQVSAGQILVVPGDR